MLPFFGELQLRGREGDVDGGVVSDGGGVWGRVEATGEGELCQNFLLVFNLGLIWGRVGGERTCRVK